MKKIIIINKPKALIDCSNSLSVMGKRLLNTLVYLSKYKKDGGYIEDIPLSLFRELMGLARNNKYSEKIKKAFTEIRSNPLILKNIKKEDGTISLYHEEVIVVSYEIKKKDGKHQTISIQLSPLVNSLLEQSNYVKINLITTNYTLKTKTAIALYELLMFFKHLKEDFVLSEKSVKFILAIQEVQRYNSVGRLIALLEKTIKEINANTDLQATFKAKEENFFSFRINQKIICY